MLCSTDVRAIPCFLKSVLPSAACYLHHIRLLTLEDNEPPSDPTTLQISYSFRADGIEHKQLTASHREYEASCDEKTSPQFYRSHQTTAYTHICTCALQCPVSAWCPVRSQLLLTNAPLLRAGSQLIDRCLRSLPRTYSFASGNLVICV